MFNSTKTVKSIFYINIIVYILTILFPVEVYTNFAMYNFDNPNFSLYQLVSYQFLHGGFMHILFNMLVLLSFGSYIENKYGARKFLIYYLLCGIFAALFHIYLSTHNSVLVGASGSIWGIMALFTILHPNEKIVFFFIPYGIKAKYLIPVLFLIEIVSSFLSNDNVSHYGHIGGGIAGVFIYFIDKYSKRLKLNRIS